MPGDPRNTMYGSPHDVTARNSFMRTKHSSFLFAKKNILKKHPVFPIILYSILYVRMLQDTPLKKNI